LLVGVSPNIEVARFVGLPNFAGYILKDEICYSLAWAVALAAEGKFVVTPGVRDLYGVRSRLPRGSLCLDGCKPLEAFSRIEEKRSRMVFIFSMERHEFADEEGISEDYSYGVVSDLFTTIGLNNILQGKVKPEAYFGHNPAVLMHVNQAIKTFQEAEKAYLEAQRAGRAHRKRDAFDTYKMPKVSEKETLAFHLLTLPDIEPII
jgi:hypothetical protein